MVEIIADNIDRLCTVEMKPGLGNLPRGMTRKLYEAARQKQGKPLTYLASKLLIDVAKNGGWFFIITGAGAPPVLPKGEVDGYLGAASIARALDLGLGIKTVVIGEERIRDPVTAAFLAAGISLVDEARAKAMHHSAAFETIPIDHAGSKARANELIGRYDPALLLAIERQGPNRKGVIHGATGISMDASHAKPQYFFEIATEKKIPTIGIGDNPNDIGFGLIYEDALKIPELPAAAKCMCPCGAGMVTVVKTDVLVEAAISDWGGYGVAACLGALLKNPLLIQDTDMMRRMLEDCVRAGALDGGYGAPTISDDEVPGPTHQSLVQMLRSLVELGLTRLDSPGH